MKQLPKIFIVLAVISVIAAIILKRGVPGMPINWMKVADTCLLFAIAIAFVGK